MVKATAPMQRGLLPWANFRGSDPRPLERVFSLSPGCGPLYGDGFEALSLQSLLRSSGEPPVIPRLRRVWVEMKINIHQTLSVALKLYLRFTASVRRTT